MGAQRPPLSSRQSLVCFAHGRVELNMGTGCQAWGGLQHCMRCVGSTAIQVTKKSTLVAFCPHSLFLFILQNQYDADVIFISSSLTKEMFLIIEKLIYLPLYLYLFNAQNISTANQTGGLISYIVNPQIRRVKNKTNLFYISPKHTICGEHTRIPAVSWISKYHK